MAFKNLADRYTQTVNTLYKGATNKFDNGKATTGRTDEPYVVRKPGNGYWGFAEGRSTPVRSAVQDVKRLTLFSISKRGLLFLAKQQLLQTGNTFEMTRIINPLFVAANAVPFLHIRRSARPITGPYGLFKKIPSTDYSDVRKIGQLQKETYNKLVGATGAASFWSKIPVIGQTLSAFSAKKNIGEDFGGHGTAASGPSWSRSRPELGKTDNAYVAIRMNADNFRFKFGGQVLQKNAYGATASNYILYYKTNVRDYGATATTVPDLTKLTPAENTTPTRTTILSEQALNNGLVDKLNASNMEQQLKTQQGALWSNYGVDSFTTVADTPYIKYFTGEQGSITGLPRVENGLIQSRNAKYEANGIARIKYIKDPANEPSTRNGAKLREAYKELQSIETRTDNKVVPAFDDPIVVSFAMGKDDHVQFRAFIKDLQQSASPEYKTYQYIGRIEKFISYVTVQREISFKLGVLAYSKDELEIVWKRINYLTGLVFPFGINRGILQPNIVRLTIGRIYVNQPGYVTSLSTNFNDITESWDIDEQVPIGATMDIKFNLIEKKTALSTTPFYGITQGIGGFADLEEVDPESSRT